MTTRDETKRRIEIMQAYIDGKNIEYYANGYWRPLAPGEQPLWNWNYIDYRIAAGYVDPYAELKAAVCDTTKEVRCTAGFGDWPWQCNRPDLFHWCYPPNHYEIRDKPKKTRKEKLLAYVDLYGTMHTRFKMSPPEPDLYWSRVPAEDREIEIVD